MAADYAISAGLWLLLAVGFVLTRGGVLLGAIALAMVLVYVVLAWRGPATAGIALNAFRIATGVVLAALVWDEFGPTAVGLLAVATQLVTMLVRRGLRQRADLV